MNLKVTLKMGYGLHSVVTEKQNGYIGWRNYLNLCGFFDLVILATSIFEIHCTKGHLNFCLWICIYLLGSYLKTCLSESLVNLEGLTGCRYLNFFPLKGSTGPCVFYRIYTPARGCNFIEIFLFVLAVQTSTNGELLVSPDENVIGQLRWGFLKIPYWVTYT